MCLGYEKPIEKIEDVLDKFEKLENDVYTDGCTSIEKLETEEFDKRNDIKDIKEDKNFADVHILILEESSLPDLEPAYDSTISKENNQVGIASLENHSDYETVEKNCKKEIFNDIVNIDSKLEEISTEGSPEIAEIDKNKESVDMIEYF